MHQIKVSGHIEMQKYIMDNDLSSYRFVDFSVGNDDKIYCLFEENIPERIDGMFVSTTNNSRYRAASLTVDWLSGEIYSSDFLDFGIQKFNYYSLQPIGENFLLLGARAYLYKNGETDKNALIIDKHGNRINEFCFGDGIESCLIDSQNNIITSYFDEGVFGNNGWDNPIGRSGIIKWSDTGEKLWENNSHDICDCYAINIDDEDALWFYYYREFNLVKTDYISETVYNPQIKGCNGFLLSKKQQALLFQKGYHESGFCIMEINDNKLSKPKDCDIIFNNEPIFTEQFAFRSSKSVFLSKGNMYFLDWIYS